MFTPHAGAVALVLCTGVAVPSYGISGGPAAVFRVQIE